MMRLKKALKSGIALLMSAAMMLGTTGLQVFAEEPVHGSAEVIVRGQGYGVYVAGGVMDTIEVSSGLAESYGYTDQIKEPKVSALDAAVAFHLQIFGAYFTEDPDAYLSVADNGFVSTMFAIPTYDNGFLVNGGYPNDGTESSYGGYNGTTVNHTEIKDDDVVDFFIYQDCVSYSDYYSFIDTEESYLPGETIEVKVTGNAVVTGYMYEDPDAFRAGAEKLEELTFGILNTETGAAAPVKKVEETDDGYLITDDAFTTVGEYYLVAMNSEGESPADITCVIMNPAKITISGAKKRISVSGQVNGEYLDNSVVGNQLIDGNKAEEYGYTDGYDLTNVTALDALVAYHETLYGDAFTPETAKNYLEISASGYVSKVFGISTSSFGFFVNAGYPNDGTESKWGGYNGTLIGDTLITEATYYIDFFVYQSEFYDDYYTFIDCDLDNIIAGTENEAVIKGTMAMMGYLYADPEDLRDAAEPVEGLYLAVIDEDTGKATIVSEEASDEDGNIKYTLPKAGDYILAAVSNPDAGVYSIMNPVWISADRCEEGYFEDVNKNAWYFDTISTAYESGLISGTSKGIFKPEENINRAAFVAILYNVADGEPVEYEKIFNDVPDGQWFTNQIIWAAKNKYVNGYANGNFGVADNITREQIAVILYNYCGVSAEDVDLSVLDDFPDADKVSSWAKNAVAWAIGRGIITGKTVNGVKNIAPKANASRAEATSMLLRFTL